MQKGNCPLAAIPQWRSAHRTLPTNAPLYRKGDIMNCTALLHKFLLASMLFSTAAAMTGCTGSADKQDPKKPAAAPAAGRGGDKAHADAKAADKADETPGLAQLSVEDRVLAEKQKVCPVSGEPLGAMAKPVKITVKGKTVFLCCSGCEEAVRKDPDKYLAKLKKSGEK
jgi:YHS domain-containing protein